MTPGGCQTNSLNCQLSEIGHFGFGRGSRVAGLASDEGMNGLLLDMRA